MVAYFNPHMGFKFHLYIWILTLLNSMISYEAKELLTVKKKKMWEKELTMFHKLMNMNRKGAASLPTNLFVVH